MVSSLGGRLMQENKDRPCIEAMITHLLKQPKTNYSGRIMMGLVPKLL